MRVSKNVLANSERAKLLYEIEERWQAQHPTCGADSGLVCKLSLGEIRGGFGGVRADQRIFLGAEIDLVLVEKILGEVDLVQGVAVGDALHLSERAVHLADGLTDVVAGLNSQENTLVGANPVKTATDFARARLANQSTISATGRVLSLPTLLDFIK